MTNWIKCLTCASLALVLELGVQFQPLQANQETNGLVIKSVVVDGNLKSFRPGGNLSLGSFPKNVSFNFGPSGPNVQAPLRTALVPGQPLTYGYPAGANIQPTLRTRARLEGFESNWHEGGGFMFLAIRFFDDSWDLVGEKTFPVTGESAGWDGSLKSSPLTHRRETLVVPPNASRAWVAISSAGPPQTVGIYVVANLVVTRSAGNLPAAVLLSASFDQKQNKTNSEIPPPDWIRDGLHPSLARIVQIGQDPPLKAFAIVDDDPNGHGEWHVSRPRAIVINPGDRLVIEWNEMFAVGVGDQRSVSYGGLPPGNYRFHVLGVNLMGLPDGDEAWVDVSVPPPLWKQPWFILVLSVFLTAVVVGCGRYLVWQQMRREMARLKNQQALESERLRIAHDIHDDLGARVTQISLLSAMSLHDPNLSEKTRADFLQIKKLSRDLVSALYETVWAVNPECDNLDALGNFLCQMANQLCERTEFHCRLQVSDLPREIQISSQMRHNVILAVKEAIHNVLKHSHGSEVEMRIALNGDVLEIAIRDNGCGFAPGGGPAGSGLKNMKQRMDDIGCDCIIESRPGSGTTIRLRLVIKRNSA